MKVRSFWSVKTGVEKLEEKDYSDSSWTTTRPPDIALDNNIPCKFIEGEWIAEPIQLLEVKKQVIRKRYSELMQQVVAPYSLEERETWFKQVLEAKNSSIPTPMLTAMAEARGITVEDLASKILENETLYNTTVGTLLGQQQKELDNLEN